MKDHDQNLNDAIVAFIVVRICPGLVLATIADAAAKRFGGFSIVAIFFAGWIAQLAFTAVLDQFKDEAA